MRKRTIYLAAAVLSAVLLLSGCGTARQTQTPAGNATDAAKTKTKKTVALVMKTLTNPFFIKMEQGARRAEKELDIKLIVKTGAQETSIDQQIAIVDQLIQQKTDAIVIAPGSSTELVPVLKKAQDAGIAIINIDNRLDVEVCKKAGLKNVPFVSVNNQKGAYLAAKYVSDQIKEPVQVIVLEGIPEAKNAQDRKKGIVQALKENPNIQLVASQTAHWKIDEAMNVTTELFSKYPGIGAIFCANDMMALGSIEYLRQTGKKYIPVAGFDALDEALTALKQGALSVTVDQNAEQQGYTGVVYAVKLLQGETVPPETMIDVKLITRENMR